MKLKLNFNNNHYIIIDVLKENLTWFNHFIKLNLKLIATSSELCPDCDKSLFEISQHYKEIIKITKKLSKQGVNIPYVLPVQCNYDQQLLNQIHRFFTYSALNNDNLNIDNFIFKINRLNTLVHKIEPLTVTPAKKYIKSKYPNFKSILFRSHTEIYGDHSWFNASESQIILQNNYLNMDNMIIMSEEIQGKSYLRAFIDNDDPREIDISGRSGSYGGFIIDLVEDRKKIYQSEEFNNWLNLYNLKKEELPLEWPLGKIREVTQPLYEFKYYDFISCEFLNPT